MKRVLVAATVVLAILLGSVSLASAAQLSLPPGSLGAFSVTDRCTQAVTVSPTTVASGSASGAQVTGLTNECAGREIQLTLFGTSGDAIVTGTTTIAASGATSADVTTTSFTAADIAGAAVTIGTWGVPATWSHTPATSPTQPSGPITAGNDDTVVSPITWNNQRSWGSYTVCFTVEVTVAGPEAAVWALNVDLQAAPFNGISGGFYRPGQDLGQLSLDYSTPGQLVISGALTGYSDWRELTPGTSRSFELCNHNSAQPAQTPSAYTVVQTPGEWTATKACVVTTVTGNGSSMFYFGWEFDVDMSAARARTNGGWGPSQNRYDVQVDNLGEERFHVSSGGQGALSGEESLTFELCSHNPNNLD